MWKKFRTKFLDFSLKMSELNKLIWSISTEILSHLAVERFKWKSVFTFSTNWSFPVYELLIKTFHWIKSIQRVSLVTIELTKAFVVLLRLLCNFLEQCTHVQVFVMEHILSLDEIKKNMNIIYKYIYCL